MLNKTNNSDVLLVPAINAQAQQTNVPLRSSVKKAVKNFLEQSGGENISDFYEIVLSEVEKPMLDMIMQHTRGNQTKAANLLGLNRGTLRKKLKKYGMG